MDQETAVYIHCPGCEYAVRPLDKTPCPHCHRCPYCGRNLKPGELNCDCETTDSVPPFLRRMIIPAELLGRERQRLVIRKDLATSKAVMMGLVAGLAMFAVTFRENLIGDVSGWPLVITLLSFFAIVVGLVQCVEWAFYRLENRRLTRWDQAS